MKTQNNNSVKPLFLSLLLFVDFSHAEVEDNPAYHDAFTAWAATHVFLLPTSFLPGPLGTFADLSSIGIDVRIKTLPAVLIAPTANEVIPNSEDDCKFSFDLPQVEAKYENLFGIADIQPLTSDWGVFSDPLPPFVEHANAQVAVRVEHINLNDWTPSNKTVTFDSGRHPLVWSANTQIDPFIDVALPFALFVISNEMKYFKSFFSIQTDPATAKRAKEIGRIFLANAGIEFGLIDIGQLDTIFTMDSARHAQTRPFTVYDIKPPVIINSDPTPQVLEANSLGGEQWQFHKDELRALITATDPCNMPLLIGNDAPFLFPLGTSFVTWTAQDTGPVGGGNTGVATIMQEILVEDTRPPIILAPPSRVIISSTEATTADFDIGTAVVFDVADANPQVTNTIGSNFLPNTRTEVLWSATDDSGNVASKSQWITVKTPNSNTPPTVNNVTANGLTSQQIDIELIGSDSDILSGIFDPLKFDISTPPANGFFVSPLIPYFIEDYRVQPGTIAGDILNTSSLPSADLYNAFCLANPAQLIPINFVYQAKFVHVTEDNTSYVLDKYWECSINSGVGITRDRLSKWDSNGQLINQIDVSQLVEGITLDADGFIYAVTPAQSSDALFLNKYDDQLNTIQSWKLDDISSFGNPRLINAIYDTNTGLIFATEKRRVYIFDGSDGQFRPSLLGTLKNAENFLSATPSIAGSSSRGFDMVIDSTGALYVVDSGLDRIHKFNPATYNNNALVVGSHIGWTGRCDNGPGCDDANNRSFGYSCSATTPCNVSQSNGVLEGQFDSPIGMAIDPNDILYVTDYDNSRVQRFTPLGDFAGVAASTCDGSCFLLGDMGKPIDISVTASKFYVLDNDRSLMHVFETAPFKEITDNSVLLTYASNNDFQGTDSFSFIANDGLVNSNIGTATINLQRNFRAPVALVDTQNVNEDEVLNFEFLAQDPDGILGINFNGLDTLTYEIIQQPVYGILSGTGASRIYTPDENFHGSDTVIFRVNDGMFDSNQAILTINVQSVNDIPQVQFTDATSKVFPKSLWPLLKGKIAGVNVQAGLGYPLPLMAEFFDPDVGQSHTLQINWGDGTNDSANQNPPIDPNNPSDVPIITKTFNGVGQIIGKHTFLSTGMKTIGVIVIDENSATSPTASAVIEVVPMVDIALEMQTIDPIDFPEPGQMTSMTIEVSNQPPTDSITALNATNVEFTGTLPVGVQLMSMQTTQGICTQFDQTSTCQLGTILPDEIITITVNILPDVNFNPATNGYVINATSSELDASVDNLTILEIPVKFADVIFTNGFE